MFTSFATENTPSIQVWEFSQSSSGLNIITLSDDCAPIQFIKSGGSTNDIRFYLPSSPIEGKRIIFINSRFNTSKQLLQIYSSDVSRYGSSYALYQLGQGQRIELFYTKNAISFGPSSGIYASGWINLSNSSGVEGNYYSFCVGDGNAATNGYSLCLGGTNNTSSGLTSSVIGGSSCTASGQNSAAIGGVSNTASGQNSAAIGGNNNSTSQSYSAALGGTSHQVSGSSAVSIGGTANVANASGSIILAGSYGTARGISSNNVSPASDGPIEANFGKSQTAKLVLGRQTTNATATVLTSNTSAATTTNQLILPNNSAYYVRGSVIANVTGGGNTSSWTFEGVIKRGANAASTTLVAAITPTLVAQDAGASAWVLAVTADTTNGGLAVTVTGAAATTIRWVCQLESTEVAF